MKLTVTRDELLAMVGEDGVLPAETMRERGISRSVQARLTAHEVLHQLAPALYSVGTPSWETRLSAALRLAGDGSAAYGGTALALHGLADRVLPVHVLVPRGSQRHDREWVVFHRSDLARRCLESHTPRRVALDDSVIDALGMLDETAAIALVTRAIQERRTTADRLLAIVESRSRVAHRVVVRRILRDGAGIESALEYAYATRVEQPHGLEPMVRQYVVPETGHRADGAYPKRRALIHLDGARYHDADADRDLDNRHAALGYASSRFTWAHCWTNPCGTAYTISGGPPPRRCRNCPPPC